MEEKLREKEFYRDRIVEMVKEIENVAILNYIYILVKDVEKEDKENE